MPDALGEQVQPVKVSRAWDGRGSPWCFGGTGAGREGEQGLGGQGVSLVLGVEGTAYG